MFSVFCISFFLLLATPAVLGNLVLAFAFPAYIYSSLHLSRRYSRNARLKPERGSSW